MEVSETVSDDREGAPSLADTDARDLGYVFGIGMFELGGSIVCESSDLACCTVHEALSSGTDAAEAVLLHD